MALSPPNRPAPAPGTGRGRRARSRATARSSSPTGSGGRSPRAAATRWRWRARRTASGSRPLLTIGKDDMATESLERPALVRTPEGRWRLYLSCATTGTKHWRVEMTEAAHPAEFDVRDRQTVLPGDAKTGVKDPVIVLPRRPVAPVGVLPSAGRPAADRPDDHRVRDQRRRPDLDMARHRAERDAGPSGTPAARGSPRCASTGTRSRPGTTAGPAPRRTTRSGPGWPPAPTRPR